MPRREKPVKKRRFFGWVLLALLCVGGVELAVCRFADPELFSQITRPVAILVDQAGSAAASALDRLSELLPPSPPEVSPTEPLPDNQLAGDPAIVEEVILEDPKITEFSVRKGQEVLTGGSVEIVYFNQGEEPWASSPYGPDTVKGYGCGPTAMAMVVSSLTQEAVDPAAMAQWAYQHGYCAPGSGSYLSIVEGTAEAYSLDVEAVPDLSSEMLRQDLASGCLFVALMTKGHFTSGGHFILLRGITLEGKVLVADPNSRERSLMAWDPELILSELSASRSSGAPLWRFSALTP